MENRWMRICCLLLMICMATAWAPASAEEEYTIDNIRQYVAGVDEPVELANGTTRPLINFDNAATTPALIPVMDEVNRKLLMYGSIGRGFSQKSNYSTELYEETRGTVLSFVGLDPLNDYDYTCFYVNNTTDGLNKLASALITDKEDLVLSTRMEHHANDLSWRERCRVIYAEVDDLGRVRYDEIERLLQDNSVKLVAVTAASNVTGYVTDVHRIAKLAHRYGAMIVVDGAQIVAHREFSMKGETPEENIDFFVFSAHKMYSPYGGGAVVGLRSVLNEHMPAFYGGGTVQIVGDNSVSYKDAPASYEAGSPDYPGVIGMGKAMEILKKVGFDAIREHEQKLIRRMIDGLEQFDNVVIYGDTENISDRVGVVTFNFSDINSYFLAMKLTELGGVATRRGAFCAHPYVWRLLGIPDDELVKYEDCGASGTPGMIRRMIDGLAQFDNVVIYGDTENISDRVGVVTFNFTDINSYFLAEKLTELGGVATRRGAFCAHPYVWRLLGVPDDELSKYEDCGESGTPGMIRVSFGIYNTEAEVDEFLKVLSEAIPAAKAYVAEQIEELGEESQAFDPSF